MQVEVLPDEAHGHYGFGDACEAQLLAVHRARVWHEDRDWHLLGLHFVLRQLELEHLTLVAEVDLLLLHLVGERDAGDERPGRLGLDVEEEVALGVEANVLLPRIVVGVERVDEQHLVPDLTVARQPKIEVNLPVVLPDLTLLMRLLQLIITLGLSFLLVFLALGGRLRGRLRISSARRRFHLHLKLRFPVYSIHYDVIVLQVALNHLYLRVCLVQLFIIAVSIENHNLKVLGEVAKAIDRSDSDPHVARDLVVLVVVAGYGVGLLLEVLLRHYMILLAGDTTVLEEVAKDALEVDDDHRVVELVRTASEIVAVGALEVLIS